MMDNNYDIAVDQSALTRIDALRQSGAGDFNAQTLLRVAVDGGGCSGFQYRIEPAKEIGNDDIVLENAVVVDEISAQYLKGSTIKFQDDLMSAMFVVDNPNATSSCGCSTSFSVDIDKLG